MKKLPLFLLFCIFSFNLAQAQKTWDDLLDSTEESITYKVIKDTADFNAYLEAVRNALTNDGKPLTANILLMNDIDLGFFFDGKDCRVKPDSTIASFAPIPLNSGIFNGNNKTITGLCVQGSENYMAGLFKQKSGLIKDLKIEGAYIEGDTAGVVIGTGINNTEGNTALLNVHVTNSTVIGKYSVGGLAGSQVFEIDSCSVTDSEIVLKSVDMNSDIGGLVGRIYNPEHSPYFIKNSFVKNSSIDAHSETEKKTGGLVGTISLSASAITTFSISNSFAEATIKTSYLGDVGGLVGYYYHNATSNQLELEIKGSYFGGSVTITDNAAASSCVGGLVGSANAIAVETSFVKGSLDAGKSNCIGGLIGKQEGGVVSKIKYSYVIASFEFTNNDLFDEYPAGIFIGSSPNGYSITSSYAVPSPSKTLPIVGGFKGVADNVFSGFYASAEGKEDFSEFEAVQDSLLRQPLAAYTLNALDDSHTSWTQLPNVNGGYPFIKPNHFYPLYKVVLNDPINKVPTKTVFNSPITGKLDPAIFKGYPVLGITDTSAYFFEEMDADSYYGNALNPKNMVTKDGEYFLSNTTRYDILYDLESFGEGQIFWIDDSLSSYNEKYDEINLPKITKANSCFAGWQPAKNGIKDKIVPVTTLEPTLNLNSFFGNDNRSDITLFAVWTPTPFGEKCNGIQSESSYEVRVNSSNGIVLLRNNGNLIVPIEYGYSIPNASIVGSGLPIPPEISLPIPINIEASPRDGYFLDSLYSVSNQLKTILSSGDQILIDSDVEITAFFNSISGEPAPPYKITYDVENDLNSETPVLFLSEDYMVQYGQDLNQNDNILPKLVQMGYSFGGWDIYCTNKGTCSQNGFPIDSLVAIPEEGESKNGSVNILEGMEGDLTLRPVFNPTETPNFVTVKLEKATGGFLTLSNNGREVLSGTGLIKYPIDEFNPQTPPIRVGAEPDSSYELEYVNAQYSTGASTTIDNLTQPKLFDGDVSLTPVFSEISFDFATNFFSQEGGAFSYSGSAGIVKSKNPVLAMLSLKNDKGWAFDTTLDPSVESYSMFGLTKVNLPTGDFTFRVSLNSSNTTVFREHTFSVDSALQFATASWQMVSLSNLDPAYQQSRDEIFYGWNDTTSLGDYWQYQELRSLKDANPLEGYWYQSLSEAPLPLKIDTDLDIDPNSNITWNLVAGKTGWNLIANPYHWSIGLGVYEQTQGHDEWIEHEPDFPQFEDNQLAFWKWNDSLGDYTRTYSLQANEAAWVQVKETQMWQTYASPYFSSLTSPVLEKAKRSTPTLARAVNKTNWRMQLKLKNAQGKEDSYNVIGISPAPSNLEEPPTGMGNLVNLSIVEGHKKLAQNILSSNAPSWTWELALSASESGTGMLEIEGVEALRQMGYRIALHLENKSIELTSNAPISVPLKKVGSTASVSVIPAETFTLAKTIDRLAYYKAGEMWNVQFEAGIDLEDCQAVLSLHNIEGKLLNEVKAKTHIGKNEVALKGTSVPGVLIVKIVIYNKNGSIVYRGHQKLLQKK